MTLHLLLDIIFAISIVLSLSNRYLKLGLSLMGATALLEAIVLFAVDKDFVLGAVYAIAAFLALYELLKARQSGYKLKKSAKILTSTVLVLLGIWALTLGTFSPFLVAGVVAMTITLLER